MSEYCSQCSPFEEYDIDLFQIALSLDNGRSENILCEGCNIVAIYKDEDGNLYLAKRIQGKITLHHLLIEELLKN